MKSVLVVLLSLIFISCEPGVVFDPQGTWIIGERKFSKFETFHEDEQFNRTSIVSSDVVNFPLVKFNRNAIYENLGLRRNVFRLIYNSEDRSIVIKNSYSVVPFYEKITNRKLFLDENNKVSLLDQTDIASNEDCDVTSIIKADITFSEDGKSLVLSESGTVNYTKGCRELLEYYQYLVMFYGDGLAGYFWYDLYVSGSINLEELTSLRQFKVSLDTKSDKTSDNIEEQSQYFSSTDFSEEKSVFNLQFALPLQDLISIANFEYLLGYKERQ